MKRREFVKNIAFGMLASQVMPVFAATHGNSATKIPVGLCNHSLRSLRLNARQLIEYAVEQKLDSVLLNTFQPFENLDSAHLLKLKKLADSNVISIYIGAGSISEKSGKFSNQYSTAKQLLLEGIRVASELGSPVVGVRIGDYNDRYTDGGIEAHIEASVKVMKSVRTQALDAGIKFAFENHAGDLRSKELLALIHETGTDICGALFDPANAVWAMEDPMKALTVLGENILCTSVRDVMAWETVEGAMFQGMAIGEGLLDFPQYAKTMRENCPGVPLHIETISNSARPVPFLNDEFLSGFPNLTTAEMVDFLKFIKKGTPQKIINPPTGIIKRDFDIQLQHAELLKSIKYLREKCNAGLKN